MVPVEHLLLALVALLPQLASRPGVVDADTKTYLLLDPAHYLRQSLSIWDPSVGLGTVTHQQIGYLFPMGPFFLATHVLGVPTWIAQRLWVGAILFAAAEGVAYLCRALGLPRRTGVVAGLLYMVSPYPLQYIGHISVILLSWAALPWMVGICAHHVAGRPRPWRRAAALALLAAAMGSVNATSLIYVGAAPLLLLIYACATRMATWGRAWQLLWRTALLGAGTCAWWAVALVIEGRYGIDVLTYTETVPAVSSTSLSSEVLRGLGYWYFYGTDNAGPWVSAMPQFTQQLWVIGLSYAVPFAAFASAVMIRWRWRGYVVALGLLGTILAVGAYPFTHPSLLGGGLRWLFETSEVGLALRSTDRAAPMVLLALVLACAAALAAIGSRAGRGGDLVGPRRRRWWWWAAAGVLVALAVLADPALWNGTSVPRTFVEPSSAPGYTLAAASALDRGATATATRVWAVPGQPFAAYDYGTTVDPLWPALLTRPFVTREQQVMGSLPTQDTLAAMDDPMQQGTESNPAGVSAMARLISAGDVLVQNDLDSSRYGQPYPGSLWAALTTPTPGLSPLTGYGAPVPTPPGHVDEGMLDQPAGVALPALGVMAVAHPRPVVRSEPVSSTVVVDGDGTGLMQGADVGLLAHDPAVVYAGTLDTVPAATWAGEVPPSAQLVVTDSNRRAPYRWDTIGEELGATLAANQRQPAGDPADHPLNLFPAAPADAQTTSRLSGVASVYASSYGNPFAYLPEDRPVQAIDGNLDTAWETDTFGDPRGQWWQVTFKAPRTIDQVNLVQPLLGGNNQWITEVTLRFDGKNARVVHLGAPSRTAAGQSVTFAPCRCRTLQITIDATNLSSSDAANGSPVGLAEVRVSDVVAQEQIVMPTDLLKRLGASSLAHRVTVIMTRQRVAPVPPRTDPEASLDRVLWTPTARSFSVTGTARIDNLADDATVSALVGRPVDPSLVPTATSSERLTGDLGAGGPAALDGNLSTAWSPDFGRDHQVGSSITVTVPAARTFDHMQLVVVADHRHSVPETLRLSTDSGTDVVSLPAIQDRSVPGATVAVPLSFPALEGDRLTVTVASARLDRVHDDESNTDTVAPVAIAELGLPGVIVPPPATSVPSVCRDDLLSVDGRPVWLALSGSSADALSGAGMAVTTCGPDATGITLGPGNHVIRAVPGTVSGVDLDQLVLDSAAGGAAMTGDGSGPGSTLAEPAVASAATDLLRIDSSQTTTIRMTMKRPTTPGWLVLGESLNSGWHASMSGAASGRDLGAPQLVDGFANGWLVTPAMFGTARTLTVTMQFAPQYLEDVALLLSLISGLACLVICMRPRRRVTLGSAQASVARDAPAVLSSGARRGATASPWGWSVAVAGAAGVLGATVLHPLGGLALALGVLAAHRSPVARSWLGLAAPVLVLATAVTMVVLQASGHAKADGGWPGHFPLANSLVWAAWAVLGADVLVGATTRRGSGEAARVSGVEGAGDARRAAPAEPPTPSSPS
ncbi:MAG: alpha-(1-_3)-arabinofuranosyltransferase domain-containing protein [Acidimicrobiales bacterium]